MILPRASTHLNRALGNSECAVETLPSVSFVNEFVFSFLHQLST